MRKVALCFAPHPDDIEIGCSFYYIYLLEQGYHVIQVSMTDGAFGIPIKEFKGKRLVRIRERELNKANKIFEKNTKTSIKIIRLGYTDGYLPLNFKIINRISNLIEEFNPSIILAPDPWYSQDYHPDHINTGRLVIFALKKLSSPQKKPIPLIFYYSFAKNQFIDVRKDWLKVTSAALSQYQSQLSPFHTKLVVAILSVFVLGKNYIRFRRFMAGYRTQLYNSSNNLIFPPNFSSDRFIHKIKYHMYHFPTLKAYEKLHTLKPSDLNIKITE